MLDNRNPGSTRDDAERWSVDLPDNFSGWQEIKISFAGMHRKEIGNGAPPTLTHALLPGSPALDAGDDTACPATDQRGTARPQGFHCDIGSYEAP